MLNLVDSKGNIGKCFDLCSKLSSIMQKINNKELKEVIDTIFLARSILSNFIMEEIQDISTFLFFLTQIEISLEILFSLFSNKKKYEDLNEDTKMKIFDQDYYLKQEIEQLNYEFVLANGVSSVSMLDDIFAKKFWIENFGNVNIVENSIFYQELKKKIQDANESKMEMLDYYLDFTNDGKISVFEFNRFLNIFGSFKKISEIINDLHQNGIHIYKVSSRRAKEVLKQNQTRGNYILRFSKSESTSFAISYFDKNNLVKHSLIESTKTGLRTKNSSRVYSSFEEFLNSHKNILTNPIFLSPKFNQISKLNVNLAIPDNLEDKKSLRKSKKYEKMFDSEEDSSDLCVICHDSKRDSVMDCKHFACCHKCSSSLKFCPICKAPNDNPFQIFVC